MLENDLQEIRRQTADHLARADYPTDSPVLPPIPAARYFDERFHQLELEHMWFKTWLVAGHVTELREAGSYKLFEQLGQSIIVAKGQDDRIRAFHNICRHRSAPLVTEPAGKAKRFVCPYHAWSFATDGRLMAVPEERNFPCLDKAASGLLPVRCEVWRGFVFINLGDDPQSLADFLKPVADRLVDFPFELMELKRHLRVEVEASWKTVFDNFIESYHLNTVHPAISRWIESRSFGVTPLRHGHAYYVLQRKNRNRIIEQQGLYPPGEFQRYEEFAINLPIFPNLSGGLDTGGFVWESFWPAGPSRTVIEIPLYGWVESNDDAYWDAVLAENVRLLGEDLAILPGVYKAMLTGHMPEIVVGYQELGIYRYHEEIDRRIGAENIPPELRIAPVMEPYVID